MLPIPPKKSGGGGDLQMQQNVGKHDAQKQLHSHRLQKGTDFFSTDNHYLSFHICRYDDVGISLTCEDTGRMFDHSLPA